MIPRLATPADVPDIAALHVQAWEETYDGLLPPSEFARRNHAFRLALWAEVIASGAPVSLLPHIGFAQIAAQRDTALRAAFPQELYTCYTLQHAHGSGAGQALLRHARGPNPAPFTAEVLKGNNRATRFYEKSGGTLLKETHEDIDGWAISNLVFGFA